MTASAAIEAIQKRGGWLSLTSTGTIRVGPPGVMRPEDLATLRKDREGSFRLIAEGIGWNERMARLIALFLAHTADLPTAPFFLGMGIHIADPDRFYEKLRCDIASGPTGPRARTGAAKDETSALEDDLTKLMEQWDDCSRR